MSRSITPLGLEYSIAKYVEASTSLTTLIRRDGLTLPKSKPYVIITILPATSYSLTKGKEAVQTKYNFQLDVYGESKRSISDIHYVLSDVLMFGRFTYYNDDGEATSKELEFGDDIIESPVFAEDVDKTSTHHSMHFGVSVSLVRHKRQL